MAENSNKIIGDYELIALLGDGAQGRVFKARAISGAAKVPEGTTVAIKVLSRASADPKEDARFKRQADILSKLSHQGICRYVDYFIWQEGEFDELKCLVMEFLDGEPLSERVARFRKGVPWDEVHAIFKCCLEALVDATGHGVVHRDLKPSNIFITRNGQAKVIDFGIARRQGGDETSTGGWKGSFDFMAPDFVNIEGFGGDEISDIFSLCVCFFQALTGELPFPSLGQNAHIGYLNRWKGEPPQISFASDKFRVLLNCRSMVRKGLQVAREERYPTFAALLEDLEKIRYRVVRHPGKEDYELIDVLGRGGFGEVYLGRCASNGRLVAVKHLFAGRQSSRFIKEAKLLQDYKHPDIVDYVDFIEVEGMGDDKEYFLVMEYLPGMPEADLRRRIRNARNGLDVGEVLELFWHYLRALQYLHENPRPIIHRDIKPGNLYAPIGHPEKAKIFDLGVARDVSGTLTTGMIPGTLDYMAPEFARPGAERGSPQSDLYALGVAMYEALTGTKPLPKLPKEDQDAFVQFVARAQNQPPIPYNAPVFSMWPKLKQILRMVLASDPKDRYRSAGEMLREVEALLREVAAVAADETEAPTRATQVNPELLTRIKQASEVKIAQLPQAAFQGAEQESSAGASAGELDLDEDGAAALAPPPIGQAAGTPSPSGPSRPRRTAGAPQETPQEPTPPPPKPKQSWSSLAMKLFAGLVVLALAGYGAYTVLRGVPAGVARKELTGYVQENAIPQATSTYVEQYQQILQKANEWYKKDLTHRPFWDDRLADLKTIADQLPLAFSKAFADAEKAVDLEKAQTLLKDWSSLEPNLGALGLDQTAYLQQRDSMRTKVDRLQFLANVKFMDRTLPDPITTAENVLAAERVARAYRESLDREWKGVTQPEVDAAHKRVREALTRNGNEYITQMRNFAVNRYENLVSGDSQWENLRAMAVNAPTLVGLIGEPYETAVADVQRAKAVKEGKAGYVAMVARMDERMPASVTSTGEVAQLAEAATLLAEFTATEWQGIEPGAFERDRKRVGDAVTQKAQAYVQQLTAAATEKLGRLEEADAEWTALQTFGQQTSLVARVQTEYEQSLRNIGALRTEQENKQAFVASVTAIRRQIPKALATPEELAAAEQAAVAYETFATREWAGISAAEVDKMRKDLRTLLADPFTAYVRGLKDRALERYGRLEDASAEWQQLSGLSEQTPKLVGLVETEYRAAVQDVGRARGDKEIYAEFTLARNAVSGAMPAAIQDSASLKQAEDASVKFEAFAARTFEGIPAEEQERARRELRARLTELGDRYVEGLKTAALERFSRMEDADAQWKQLAAIRAEAPVFSKIIQRSYAQAVRAVSTARDNRQNLAAYMTARSAVADALPKAISAPADVDRAETAAKAYAPFAERAWTGVDAQEQAQEKERLRVQLVTLATSYIGGLKQSAMAQLDALQDAEAQLSALRELQKRAPSLVALVSADYDDTLRNVELAQRKKEGISEFTTALEKVYDLLRGEIDSPAQLARKESALKAFEEMKAQPWESVAAEERTKAFTEIDGSLTRSISAYVAGLRTTILTRISAMDDASAQIAALREIGTKAPGLAARIPADYQQALADVDAAARNIELLAAFQNALGEVDKSLPPALTTQEQLAAADKAAAAFKAVAAKTWEGVPKDRLDKALADRRAALVDLAGSRVAQLRKEAIGLYETLENGDPAWSALQEIELRAPSLVELVTQEFHEALAETNDARKRKVGITEFRETVAKIDASIPATIDGPTQLTHAEQAATALRQAADRDWDGVPAAEKSAALRPLEEKLSDRLGQRIDQLAGDAQKKFDALEDGEPSWVELESLGKKAPTLVQARGQAYTAAVQRVQTSRDRKMGQSEFRNALAAVRESTPAEIRAPKDLVSAEKAAVLYQSAAATTWPAVAPADLRSGLDAERAGLERVVRGYIERLKTEAETLYGRGESGDAQLAELEALPTKAPQLAALGGDSQAAAVTSARRVRDRMGALTAFRREVTRVSGMVPATIADKTQLAQAETAVTAYQELAAREWPEIPSSEKTDALGAIRSALVTGVTVYIEGVTGRAVEQYGKMENADPLLEELTAVSRDAPNLVGMVFNAYERAVARVRGARDQMRTVFVEKKEAEAFAKVQQAWDTVQAAWKSGTITGMKEAYQTLLGGSFELAKFAEPYAEIRKAFSEGLQSRLGQVLGQAETSIAEYLAFLFQVDDPSLSGSYRATGGTAPKVAFELPPIADLKDLNLGVPYLGLVRLEAWSRAAAGLGADRSRRALAATLKELAAECRKQGLADQAAVCEFHRAVLESQPQVFPRDVTEMEKPIDMMRWRAHANYQPEVSAKEVLSDLGRYAAGGGTLNEYDLRLAFFAAYYSWRNAIDGEQKYAQEVQGYLKQILEAAKGDAGEAAVDFLIGHAEGAYDDEEEFPGLYMLRAISRMSSESPLVKSARQWMAADGAGKPYSDHLAVIKQQVDLLDRLLK